MTTVDRTLKRNNLVPPLVARLSFAAEDEDLTAFIGLATPVTFTMRRRGEVLAKIDAAPAAVSAVGAGWVEVEYEWQVGDTDTDGLYFGSFTFDLAGRPLDAPTNGFLSLRVIPQL